MSNIAKQVIGLLMVTTLAFLILTHSAGFAKSISATGSSFAVVAKTLQGRWVLPGFRSRRTSPGMFLGNTPPPQDISLALMEQTHVGLVDMPGIRLAETTARSSTTYHGADLTPQQFVRSPAGPNSPEQLDQAPIALNARQALSRNRGLPGVL